MSISPPSSYVADDVEHQLDPNMIRASRLSSLVVFGPLGLIALVVLALLAIFVLPPLGSLLLFGAWSAVGGLLALFVWRWPALRFKYASYRVSPARIKICRGVLWRSIVDVPQSRVQHTDVSQGPIERSFGLATLVIHTAGTEHASVRLGGLPRDVAYAIRDHLIDGDTDDAV